MRNRRLPSEIWEDDWKDAFSTRLDLSVLESSAWESAEEQVEAPDEEQVRPHADDLLLSASPPPPPIPTPEQLKGRVGGVWASLSQLEEELERTYEARLLAKIRQLEQAWIEKEVRLARDLANLRTQRREHATLIRRCRESLRDLDRQREEFDQRVAARVESVLAERNAATAESCRSGRRGVDVGPRRRRRIRSRRVRARV